MFTIDTKDAICSSGEDDVPRETPVVPVPVPVPAVELAVELVGIK